MNILIYIYIIYSIFKYSTLINYDCQIDKNLERDRESVRLLATQQHILHRPMSPQIYLPGLLQRHRRWPESAAHP